MPGRAPLPPVWWVCRSGAQGVACFLCRLLTLPLVYFLSPIPPTPFPAGRGRSKVYFAGGFAPGTPALDRSRHLQLLLCGHLAQGSQWFAVTPTEVLSYEQCRQPRRGGTGGDGTIRRKRRRRLRWSSPPGQGEQVPPGAPPLASPRRNRKRHGLNLRCRCHGGGKTRAALAVSAASGSFFRNGHEPWLRQ